MASNLFIISYLLLFVLNVTKQNDFLIKYDQEMSKIGSRHSEAVWNHLTHNKTLLDAEVAMSEFVYKTWEKVKRIPWNEVNDSLVRRQFEKLSKIGQDALPKRELEKLRSLVADMETFYKTATVCTDPQMKCRQALEPELVDVMANSHDDDVLAHTWRAWRDATGKKMRKQFLEYIRLMNKAAKLNGFDNAGSMWRDNSTLIQEVENVWQKIVPFYEHLHSYVRRQLMKKFSEGQIQEDGPIPVHLLGDMWGESWQAIQYFSKPFCEKCDLDVTSEMIQKKITPRKMFEMAEDYFVSMGLKPIPSTFWNNSIISHSEVMCHPSAHDFHNRHDFRVKMCTKVNMDDLSTVHRQLALIEYFMHYSHQPYLFQDGPASGFLQGVADALALTIATPEHLHKIGLLHEVTQDKETDMNWLYTIALKEVAALPLAYLLDIWRWNIFRTKKDYLFNRSWWQLRLDYQGVCPPFARTEQDLDAGAIYDVAANIPSISTFVGTILQYQFLKALCNHSGYVGVLHRCDLYDAKRAGNILIELMQKGSSLSWSDALQIVTGERHLSAEPLLQFFAPLINWLEEENKGQVVGWRSDDPMTCPNDSFTSFQPFVT